MHIVVDWPHRRLFPNARVHWASKASLVHSTRQRAGIQAAAALLTAPEEERLWLNSDAKIPYGLTIVPPDRRRRDEDNVIASLKSSLDGIAEGLGVNDSRFRLSWIRWEEPSKMAHIDIAIMEPPPLDFLESFNVRFKASLANR